MLTPNWKSLISLTAVGAALLSSACTVPVGVTEAIQVFTIQGSVLGGVLPPQQINLPLISGSQSIPPGAKAIHLVDIGFRTVLADSSDQTEDALKNAGLVDQCRTNQDHLGFIQSVTIKIKRQDQDDSQAVLLAQYKKASSSDNPCGFHLTPSDVNLKDFLPNYSLLTDAEGTSPNHDVKVGGYISLESDEGV